MTGAGGHSSKEMGLSQEDFDRFLVWLDPDRDRAGHRYEDIRLRLTKLFFHRGCFAPEELADETIDRVIKKVRYIADSYVGDQASYFYGVAHNVYLEFLRKRPIDPLSLPETYTDEDKELLHHCLDHCLEKLEPENRKLISEYYREEKQQKIDYRKEIAARMSISLNTLRMRAFRIKAALYRAIIDCLKRSDVN